MTRQIWIDRRTVPGHVPQERPPVVDRDTARSPGAGPQIRAASESWQDRRGMQRIRRAPAADRHRLSALRARPCPPSANPDTFNTSTSKYKPLFGETAQRTSPGAVSHRQNRGSDRWQHNPRDSSAPPHRDSMRQPSRRGHP